MENINQLIENLKNCNLSEKDKTLLIAKLQDTPIDKDEFLKIFFLIVEISKELLEIFDIGNN